MSLLSFGGEGVDALPLLLVLGGYVGEVVHGEAPLGCVGQVEPRLVHGVVRNRIILAACTV